MFMWQSGGNAENFEPFLRFIILCVFLRLRPAITTSKCCNEMIPFHVISTQETIDIDNHLVMNGSIL